MLIANLEKKLKIHDENGLTRKRDIITTKDHNIFVVNGKPLINFCSNDYLGIATDPKVKKALMKGVEQYGLGSTASAQVSGYHESHVKLEQKFADFLQRKRALYFNSGYHANLAVMTVLANRSTTILSDKLCHASLLDGIQLSRAKHKRFLHNNIEHCSSLLKDSQNNLIVTEGVFSMEGGISPIPSLVTLAKQHGSTLIVDDAHGFGVLGNHGGGVCEHFSLTEQDVPCLIIPLGKAVGSMGAIVAGPHVLIESLLQFSNTYRYSTALPPALAEATLTSLDILAEETWRREKLNILITLFNQAALKRSLKLASIDKTPIKSIIIGDNAKTLNIKKLLTEQGFFISCIRPPTVPKNTARIRISLNCFHEANDIERLLDLIADYHA